MTNALFMIAQQANPLYLNGRAVQQLDIVEGTIELGFLRGKIPFIGQVASGFVGGMP
jgi:hypothetical protein